MTEVLATYVDETFPPLTVEMARLVFEAIQPALGGPATPPEDSDAELAWKSVVRLAWSLPFPALGDALARLQTAEGPQARDAEYAFTWGIYHSRAEGEDLV